MASRFLVKDRENKPYALVEISAEGTTFFPAVTGAKSWSKWMTEEFAGKKITREQLTVTLDNSMSVESSVSDSVVEEIKNRAEKKDEQEKKDAQSEGNLVPVVSLMDIQLSEFSSDIWKNAVQYKAVAFIADQNKSSFSYEVKRTRAVWDPSLAVPGTDRRGGFRCPVGTRYGGQITDRFGRNCGWGVARRLANEISDLGERLENVGDRRRERRVARRNERMARRLAEGGAIERGARAIGDALDLTGMGGRQRGGRQRVGQQTEAKPVGRIERAARRVAEIADPDRGRGQAAPAARPRNRRGEGLRDSEARRMEREIVRPGAARTGPQLGGMLDENGNVIPVGGGRRPAPRPRPAAPVRPARPRPARPAAQRPAPAPRDNVSNVPVPAGAPAARESLDAYKLRKYNEHQAEVRRIRERGGRAGFLRREEWERFHGPAVEAAWRERNPDAPEAAPAAPRPAARPRPNAGRNRRTGAAAQNGRRPATRRPRPADQPDAVQPRAPRPRRPRPAPADAPTGSRRRRAAIVNVKEQDNKIGDIGADGLPDIRHIPKGNKNLATQADANQHLANGGDIRDVPDDFLHQAMKANSGAGKRFTSSTLGNPGVNGQSNLFTDNNTGKKYIIKYSGDFGGRRMYGNHEDINEIVGNNVAGRLGFAVGEFRFAGPVFDTGRKKGRAIMFEHVGNYVDGTIGPPVSPQQMPVQDRVRATFLDYMIMNSDRHRNNYFIATQNGQKRFVPIDNGLGFRGRPGYFQSGDYASVAGFREWLGDHRGGGLNGMRGSLRTAGREEVLREIAAAQDALRAAQAERDIADFGRAAVAGRGDPSGSALSPGHNDHTAGVAARQNFLLNLQPTQIYDLLIG